MKLLYIGKFMFKKDGETAYALPAYGDAFWQKYLDVFEEVTVLAEGIKAYLDDGSVAEITDSRIKVHILPPNTNPKDFKNDGLVKRELEKHIRQAEAVLIKPACRKGIMAIKICKKLKKPYMIELTGDLNLTLQQNPSILKRLYSPILHRQIVAAIQDCQYGLYVTREYLQKIYPIQGLQCGCTDTCIPDPQEEILQQRLDKINNLTKDSKFRIGMIASYHDNRKGLDTAIEALEKLAMGNVSLHILGLGTQEDRNRWIQFADEHGVKDQLLFDPSLSTVEGVLQWDDTMDLIILPSRSEGLPRCLVEAISRACPCILSNVCGMPELVECEWLHDPGDSETLAALIKRMFSDPEIMKKTAQINFEKSKEYTFETLRERRNAFLNEFKDYCKKNEVIE